MALSGVEIFKQLPKKTGCKECGFPTCLAFAMKLAAKQVSIDACKYVSPEAKEFLGAASAPPIRAITIGNGDKAVKVGEENVMFRHDKKFVNPCAFALSIEDTSHDDEILKSVEDVKNSEIDRVGQKLSVEMIAVIDKSGDPGRFGEVVNKIVTAGSDIPLILCSTNPSVIEAGLARCNGNRPLIHAAVADNFEQMAKLAVDKKASLVVQAGGNEELSELVEKVKSNGAQDIVLDPGSRNAKSMIEDYTVIRRAAIKKSFKPLGFPVISFIEKDDPFLEAAAASIAIAKYSSIVVLKGIERWKMLSLLTLRQNIYTDPQVPMQVESKVYKVGSPDADSPLLITTNFSLTYFIVQGEIENSKVPAWLIIMDVEGLSVLTAWAAGKFTAAKIAAYIKECGIESEISRKELILPGYVAILSGALEDKLGEGWKVLIGPREANALPAYLKNR